jgi:hypothetical protein
MPKIPPPLGDKVATLEYENSQLRKMLSKSEQERVSLELGFKSDIFKLQRDVNAIKRKLKMNP